MKQSDAEPTAIELGPQHAGDDDFTRRMRFHQSWYRAVVLGLDYGVGPRASSKNRYGNMLTPADGNAGRNFLTPQIFDGVQQRLAEPAGGVEEYRVKHNMLSSQPMCFNLFGPLIDDLDLATRLVRGVWRPLGKRVKRVTGIRIEWAPAPRGEFLDDRTAFDAFIEYECDSGGRGFVGIETKLTEPFSQKHDDKPTYRRWMTPDSPWRPDAADEVDRVEHNQLWRDHLLAWSMLRHPRSPYEEGSLAVVSHPEDRRCTDVLGGYRALLQDDATLDAIGLDAIVGKWRELLGEGSWLDAFHVRYLDLQRSADISGGTGTTSQPRSDAAPTAQPGAHTAPRPLDRSPTGPLQAGHMLCLTEMETPDGYPRTRALYRQALGGVDVYLRPTASGFTVLSLDAGRCASMIGVGGRDTRQHTIKRLPPERASVEAAVAGYEAKRGTLGRSSEEERYALDLMTAALSDPQGPALPRPDTYLVAQEWRLPSGDKLDLLAVNIRTGRLVVIELKASESAARERDANKGGDAWEQAVQYASALHDHRTDLYPFFERLARALGRHHGGPRELVNLALDPEATPETAVSWPGGGFRP